MKCSLSTSNFLEEILVFLILLFSSISLHGSLRKAFLSLLAILWNSAFRCLYLSFSPLLFTSLLFTAICKASSDDHFAFLHFFFLGMVLIPASRTMSQTSVHSSSGTLSIRSSPLTTLQVDISSFYGLRVFKTLTNTQLVSGKAGIQSQTCADAKNSCSLPVSLQQIAELSAKFSLQSR